MKRYKRIKLLSILLLFIFYSGSLTNSQNLTFNSASNGSDGALDFSDVEPGTTLLFDPANMNPPLDSDGDNIFHFTTINIPEGVTVRMLAPQLNWSPVYWLASGEVHIGGHLNLDGSPGHLGNAQTEDRRPSIPGPGGYPGGIGEDNLNQAIGGFGPGRSTMPGVSASYGTTTGNTPIYGNIYLNPLIGGSGGSGGRRSGTAVGEGGGAGGGAILIASSELISVSGVISANGGQINQIGGKGSGGAIHLLAPVIEGNGKILTAGLNNFTGIGRIRLEAFDHSFSGEIVGVYRLITLVPNVNFLPEEIFPKIRVIRVNGQNVIQIPSGSFLNPDVSLDTSDPVVVEVQASNIPINTVVTLTIFNENEPLQVVNTTPLQGTLEQSTATAEVTFPPGFSRGWIYAKW